MKAENRWIKEAGDRGASQSSNPSFVLRWKERLSTLKPLTKRAFGLTVEVYCEAHPAPRSLLGEQAFTWADLQICSRQIDARPQDSEEQRGGFRFDERSPGVLSGYPCKHHLMTKTGPGDARFVGCFQSAKPVSLGCARSVSASHQSCPFHPP